MGSGLASPSFPPFFGSNPTAIFTSSMTASGSASVHMDEPIGDTQVTVVASSNSSNSEPPASWDGYTEGGTSFDDFAESSAGAECPPDEEVSPTALSWWDSRPPPPAADPSHPSLERQDDPQAAVPRDQDAEAMRVYPYCLPILSFLGVDNTPIRKSAALRRRTADATPRVFIWGQPCSRCLGPLWEDLRRPHPYSGMPPCPRVCTLCHAFFHRHCALQHAPCAHLRQQALAFGVPPFLKGRGWIQPISHHVSPDSLPTTATKRKLWAVWPGSTQTAGPKAKPPASQKKASKRRKKMQQQKPAPPTSLPAGGSHDARQAALLGSSSSSRQEEPQAPADLSPAPREPLEVPATCGDLGSTFPAPAPESFSSWAIRMEQEREWASLYRTRSPPAPEDNLVIPSSYLAESSSRQG